MTGCWPVLMSPAVARAHGCSSASTKCSGPDTARFRYRMFRNHSGSSWVCRGGVIPLLVLAAATFTAGASPTFRPDDPAAAASETADAGGAQRREITHLRDAWNAIWKRGDASTRRALDVNTIDEVPDSSWFENRLGARPMTTAEIAAGPAGQ